MVYSNRWGHLHRMDIEFMLDEAERNQDHEAADELERLAEQERSDREAVETW